MDSRIRCAGVFSLMSLAVVLPVISNACAPAPPPNVVVEIASESAIIVWDESTKTQHFIRRAAFRAQTTGDQPVQDFGFLVPTPTQPTLAEAKDEAFDELAKFTAPKTVHQPRPSGGGCGFGCGMSKAPETAAADVAVLDEKHVAGYDAKVLKANNADALTTWLNERGYEIRPALTDWLKPYIDKGWIITAFKIARDPQATTESAIGSSAVRMSFQTDAPFFPYREPEDMREAKGRRLLRIYFIGQSKTTGKLGESGLWPGKLAWANKMSPEQWKLVQPLIAINEYQPHDLPWLTEFEDPSSPRPGNDDLVFAKHADNLPVERPPKIVYTASAHTGALPTYLVITVALISIYLIRRLRLVGAP